MMRSPLHAEHVRLGARFVPFGGWEMPVQYEGVMAEHRSVRTAAGLFDVSHMGEIEVTGAGAEATLQRLTPNDVGRLAPGQAHYSALLTHEGTFVDDLLVYRLAPDRFLLVVNAANVDADLSWMQEHGGADAHIENRSADWALLALQGPEAAIVLRQVLGIEPDRLQPFRFAEIERRGAHLLLSRTGYTGEDGFEIYLPPDAAAELWRTCLATGARAGVRPCGLGARDTLRLEAALCLYGQDIDRTTTAWEAGLGFIVKMKKGAFIGHEALERQKQDGLRQRLTGFRLEGRGVPRPGCELLKDGRPVGTVTSGTHSPTLGQGIGLTYLPIELRQPGTAVTVRIRTSEVPARTVALPFYRRPDR